MLVDDDGTVRVMARGTRNNLKGDLRKSEAFVEEAWAALRSMEL